MAFQLNSELNDPLENRKRIRQPLDIPAPQPSKQAGFLGGKLNMAGDLIAPLTAPTGLEPFIEEKAQSGHPVQAFGLELLGGVKHLSDFGTGIGKMILTGMQRVAGEMGVTAAEGLGLVGKEGLEIKNPVSKFLLGTDRLTPWSTQLEGAFQRYGRDIVTAVAWGLMKSTEALGPTQLIPGIKVTKMNAAGNLAEEVIRPPTGIVSALKEVTPGVGALVNRLMSKEVSPVARWVGEKDFQRMNEMGKNIPNGVPFDEQARVAENYAKDMVLTEDVYKSHLPEDMKMGTPKYETAISKISDEQALTKLTRTGKNPIDGVFEAYRKYQAQADAQGFDMNNLSIENQAAKERFSKIEEQAQANLQSSEAQSFLSKVPPNKRAKLTEDFLDKTRKMYWDEAVGKDTAAVPTTQKMNLDNISYDLAKKITKPVQDIVPVNLPTGAQATEAAMWMADNGWLDKTAGAPMLIEFFKANPVYAKYAPYIFDELKNLEAIGEPALQGRNIADILREKIFNAPEEQSLHFKPGTKEFDIENANKQQGIAYMSGPETMKGKYPEMQKNLAEYGMKDIIPYRATGGAVPFEKPTSNILEQTRRTVRDLIQKTGLSPQGVSQGDMIAAGNRQFYKALYERGIKEEIPLENGGTMSPDQVKIKLLRDAKAQDPTGFWDFLIKTKGMDSPLSLIKTEDIQKSLGVSVKIAKDIKESLRASKNIPTEYVGIPEKIINTVRYSNTFIGTAYQKFIQATLMGHFVITPIFGIRVLEKFNYLSMGLGGVVNLGKLSEGIAPYINKGLAKFGLREIMGEKMPPAYLEWYHSVIKEGKLGLLDNSDLIQNADNLLGDAGKTLNYSEKNILLGKIGYSTTAHGAQNAAKTLERLGFFSEEPTAEGRLLDMAKQAEAKPAVIDLLRKQDEALFHYEQGFLTSPMMKSLNIMFYPIRFSTKVAILTGRALDKMPLLIQNTIVHQLGSLVLYSKSEEGQQFYKENKEMIDFINYWNPYHHLSQLVNAGLKGEIFNMGLFGGISAGFITQIFIQEGIIKNTYGKKIQTIPRKGLFSAEAVSRFISGMVGSLFSLPVYTMVAPFRDKRDLQNIWSLRKTIEAIPQTIFNTAPRFGESKINNRNSKPRPKHLVPEDWPEPFKSAMEILLNEREENPDAFIDIQQ